MVNSIKAWPYTEAARIGERSDKDTVVFQTGFGPSGLPHIGTFSEVYRTNLVRKAYEDIFSKKTALYVFSDDLDALRRAPDNVPDPDAMNQYIGISLSEIPDPWGEYESFADHNNARLRSFLDRFGFEYEFLSAADMYRNDDRFNDVLERFVARHNAIRDIVVPTLGEDRSRTYSPFLPIRSDGLIEELRCVSVDPIANKLTFETDNGDRQVFSALRGGSKLQWKADWAMRWIALGVDYEMCGKDLTDSYRVSSQIARAVGGRPPVNLIYEMFLDENGTKISKSKGNGLTIGQWLSYGTEESLRYFLYQSPKKAKELSPRVVARSNIDLANHAARYLGYDADDRDARLNNPAYYAFDGEVMDDEGVTFDLLLNLARTIAPRDPATLARFVETNLGVNVDQNSYLNRLVIAVICYYWDHCSQGVERRSPTIEEAAAITMLRDLLMRDTTNSSTAEDIQTITYEVGKKFYGKEDLRLWFKAIYEIILGQDSGPRFGNFAKLLGREETLNLLDDILKGNDQ